MNPILKEKGEMLDKIIKKSKALAKFARNHKDMTIEEKILLVANRDLYDTFFKKSQTTPTSGAVKVSSEYYRLILDKYK